MLGSRTLRLAAAALLLSAPAEALSPIHSRPCPAVLIAPAASGLAGALPHAALSLPLSAVPTRLGGPALKPLSSLPLLRRLGGLLDRGRDLGLTLGAFWSGAAPLAGAAADVPLQASRRGDREFLAVAVLAARASPTGADVLDRVAALGRPIRVRVRDLGGNYGEYDYMEDRLDIHSRFRDDPALAAPTLIHELLHILQHAEGVPAEALELELEAHIITLRVMEELGIESEGSFSTEAARRLAMGPEEYIAWMREQLPGKTLLIGSDFKKVLSGLEDELTDLEASEASGKRAQARLDWALHDVQLLRSAAGRRRYRAFADRVAALMADEHRRRSRTE